MPARLDLKLVRQLAGCFPDNAQVWRTLSTRDFIADRAGRFFSDWSSIKHLEEIGGVYAILLPVAWFSAPRTLHLHAPHSHKGVPIPFEFTIPELTIDGYGVVYVGRSANLAQRWRGHLTPGDRNKGGQVKYGLADCEFEADLTRALQALRENARIVYTVLSGPDQCANRDILECSLCARFGPPFNIKSER